MNKPSKLINSLLVILCVASAGAAAEPRMAAGWLDQTYTFSGPVFEIAATPDGSILVAENHTIKEIRRGETGEVIDIPTVNGSPITGLSSIGRRSFFAGSGRVFAQEQGAALWRVSNGIARRVVDIQDFEEAHDPDVLEGPQWADPRCNDVAPFLAGPQSDPFHLTRLSGSEALIADAAGNTLLWAKSNGNIDWVALFTPATADGSGSIDPVDWLMGPGAGGAEFCFVQPVPTSVAIGPDGAYYVGELTGVTEPGLPIGLSRVWRIEPGARNVVCPSADCEVVLSGLTSVIDLAFGPDDMLYVLEYDENSWLAPFIGAILGGTINRCDVSTTPGTCSVAVEGLVLPGAITFDTWDNLWVVENNIGTPMVRRVDLP